MTRTTPDGTWKYTHTPGTNPVTTVTDPQGNNIVYTFYSPVFQIKKQVYNSGGIDTAHLVQTVITCYNNPSSTPANCNSVFGLQVTEKDEYTAYPGVTGYSAVKTTYTTGGLVTDVKTFDFNATTPTNEKKIVYGSGSPTTQTCTAIGNFIIAKPCSITLYDSHNNAILSQTWNSYDGYGNLLQTWNLVSGSGASGTYLTKTYTYDSHGVVQTMTEKLLAGGSYVTGGGMNYTTTSCNSMFVTSQYPTNFTNLTTSQTWDCNGGVVTSSTDANGQTTHEDFYSGTSADPFYRPVNSKTNSTMSPRLLTLPTAQRACFCLTVSIIIDTLSTTDSIGRPAISQRRQGPSNANWDTISRTFDSDEQGSRPVFRALREQV